MRTLDELYADVPSIECRGKCHVSCGPIDMSEAERSRIRDLGFDIPRWTPEAAARWARQERLDCPALGALHQCRVYDARPLICRLWGVTEGMLCPFGCRAERILTDREAFALIAEALTIGGHPEYNRRLLDDAVRAWDNPELAAMLKRVMARSGGGPLA